jgi:ATP-dependent 26S proteasome regulatory subunit
MAIRDGRNAILQVHTKKLKLAEDVDLDRRATS